MVLSGLVTFDITIASAANNDVSLALRSKARAQSLPCLKRDWLIFSTLSILNQTSGMDIDAVASALS